VTARRREQKCTHTELARGTPLREDVVTVLRYRERVTARSMTNPRVASRFRRTGQIVGIWVIAIGVAVSLGWIFRVPALQRLHPWLGAMKLNTALALILLGAALALANDRSISRGAIRALAGGAAVIGAATLVEYVLGYDFGIDELLGRDPETIGVRGRMSPATACVVLLLGVALAWIDTWWAEWLALLGGLLAHLAVLGYLYGVADLYAIGPFSSMALHAAGGLYGVALGALFARPERGVMRLVASDTSGGLLARRLLPAVVVLPALLGVLRQWGEHAGLYGTGVGRALLVASNSVMFGVLVWRTAAALAVTEARRRVAEDDLRAREAHLVQEQRDSSLVRVELVRSNERLRAVAAVSGTFARAATSSQALLDQVTRTIADLIGDGCVVTLLSEDGRSLINASNAHRDPALELVYRRYLEGVALSAIDSPAISAAVARTGVPRRAEISPAAMVAQSEDALKPLIEQLNVHGFAVVPIRAHDQILGTLSLVRSGPGVSYDEDDVTLLQDLADRAGLAIENARLYEQLERRVRSRTKQMEHANRELEAFSYSVAHDLRGPLRGIAGFSQALLEDYSDRLDLAGRDYLTRIDSSAKRMAELIDDLLRLARVSRVELRRARVDVTAIARDVLARLGAAEPAREIELVVEDGLIAQADAGLLEIVLTNLLGNAWKFTGKRTRPRIELATSPDEPPTTYVVRDNGAGFDVAYSGKLFGVFERLHGADEFEGTGIGLAIVQRIIDRHGGRIWARGEVGQGATFYFTLGPQRDAPGAR